MRLSNYWKAFYILILGMALGAGIFAGAMTAPVVFHANDYIPGATLNHYQMGSLMSELFARLNILIILSLVAILIEEVRKFRFREKDTFESLSAVLILIAGTLFAFYYVPEILTLQSQGPEATVTEAFANLHDASEMWFKVYALFMAVLIIRKMIKKA